MKGGILVGAVAAFCVPATVISLPLSEIVGLTLTCEKSNLYIAIYIGTAHGGLLQQPGVIDGPTVRV
jgi:hypothetical protein